jgi:hypothetical protein
MTPYDESEDARDRVAAMTDDRALVAYESKWRRRLVRLLRRHPARWRLPGLSDEELIDELLLRLLAAVRTGTREPAERTDGQWSLRFLAREQRKMRRAFRLDVVLAAPADAPGFGLEPRSAEDLLLEEEHASLRSRATAQAEASLSRPQRRWLAAMKMSANAGAFFEASGKPNLSEAARLLDRNRSSATRAFEELQGRFAHERIKAEGPA